jgi:hypothetical protein
MPSRIEVWSTSGPGGAAAARVLYRARRRRARIASAAITRLLPKRAGRPLPAALVQSVVSTIASDIGIRIDAAAALHARESQRWLFALTGPDDTGVVIKLGMVDDEGLAREAATMMRLATEPRLRVPSVRWHGEHKGWLGVVTDIATRSTLSAEPDLEDARTAACALATSSNGFVVHGDLAPWNIVPTAAGLVLVDWEDSRFDDDPMFDLSHYVTRAGALLQAWRPPVAVRHLTDPGSIGWRYMEEVGLDPTSAPEHLVRYLQRAETRSQAVRRYQAGMLAALQSRSAGR